MQKCDWSMIFEFRLKPCIFFYSVLSLPQNSPRNYHSMRSWHSILHHTKDELMTSTPTQNTVEMWKHSVRCPRGDQSIEDSTVIRYVICKVHLATMVTQYTMYTEYWGFLWHIRKWKGVITESCLCTCVSVYFGKYSTATTFSAVPTCPSLFMTDEDHSQLLKLVTTMSLWG